MCYIIWEPDENRNGPGSPGAFEYNDSANFPRVSNGEGIGRLHNKKGGSILALAAHVVFISREAFDKDSLSAGTPQASERSGGKTYLWWSPFSPSGGGP
jgi:hypothetical protein